jgi:hypothetical protein
LTACAARPLPANLKTPCASGDPSGVETVSDLEKFSLGQEAALQTCEAKRAALVELLTAKGGK